MIQLPTGGGKTALTAHMIKTAHSKGQSSIFMVHRRELVQQSARAFSKIGLDYGIISAGFKFEPDKKVQIASIQTLTRRLHLLKHRPNLLVVDECHHLAAKNWAAVYNYFNESYVIGLTATPIRLDRKGLSQFFSVMVNGPSMRWLIDNGYLSDYKLFASQDVDTSNLHTKMGDYAIAEVESLVKQSSFTGNAINEYKKHCYNKRAVVFCASIAHSKYVCDLFNQQGVRAECIDGSDNSAYREDTLKRFASGEVKILCNVDLFGEGFDLPEIEAVILLRPTQSLGLYMQQVGRALRPTPGKAYAIIIDHVGNWKRHGLPDDEREWSLEGQPKSKDSIPSAKTCPICFAAMPSLKMVCPECGHSFHVEQKQNATLEFDTTELKEIDKTQHRKSKIDVDRAKAKTKDELLALAISRGYAKPHGWVHHIMQSRQRKKLNK